MLPRRIKAHSLPGNAQMLWFFCGFIMIDLFALLETDRERGAGTVLLQILDSMFPSRRGYRVRAALLAMHLKHPTCDG